MLVNAKIKRFVSSGEYDDKAFMELFYDAGIEFEALDPKVKNWQYVGFEACRQAILKEVE